MSIPTQFSKRIRDGFTLIELIVVITIIGILSTFLFSNFVNSQQRARDQQRKTDLQNIRTALESLKLDKGLYPVVGGTGYPADCGAASQLRSGTTVYMREFPCDPSYESTDWGGGEYFYCTDTFTYALFACLENTSDTDANAVVDTSTLTLPSGCAGTVPSGCSKYYYLSNI